MVQAIFYTLKFYVGYYKTIIHWFVSDEYYLIYLINSNLIVVFV